MLRKTLLAGLCSLGLAACATEGAELEAYALDVDGDGEINCSDVEQVHICMHGGDLDECVMSDVSGDGMIDDMDLHGMHKGMTEMGLECAAPPVHDGMGGGGMDGMGNCGGDMPSGDDSDMPGGDGEDDGPGTGDDGDMPGGDGEDDGPGTGDGPGAGA